MAQFSQFPDIDKEWKVEEEKFVDDILWDIRKLVGMCIREISLNNTEPLVILGKIKPILAQHDVTEEKIRKKIKYLVERIREKQ